MSGLGRRLAGAAALAAALLLPAGVRADEPASGPAVEVSDALLANQRVAAPGLLTGGAPVDAAGYQALYDAGIRTFVDLRGDEELTPEIEGWIADAGLVHVRIPITGEADLDLGAARAYEDVLAQPTEGTTAVVCRTGNRSGALVALEAHWLRGVPAEEALELGLAAGLTRLEPAVRQLLGLPPLEPAPPVEEAPVEPSPTTP